MLSQTHLIFGSLNGNAENDNDRTASYPSLLTSHVALEARRHAQLLAAKSNTQSETLLVPSITRSIGFNVPVNFLRASSRPRSSIR